MAKQKTTTIINHIRNRVRGDSAALARLCGSGIPQLGHSLSPTLTIPLQCLQVSSLINSGWQ